MKEQSTLHDQAESYQPISKLGDGSFGEVWLVNDPKIQEKVALKYLKLETAGEEYLELFKREFQILSEIRHTNLACVFDFGYSEVKKQYFFTSEYCPGEEFLEAAEGKPIPYIEEMLVQTLSALDYVHSQGIVHFDIKSENILVAEKGDHPQVKVLDFGVAAKLKSLPEGVAGTPSYMAPEIIAGEAKVDHRADLYSLGILLLRTLTKRLPFDIKDTDAVLEWHVKGDLPKDIWKDRKVPTYLREITEKLLKKNPTDRFSSARVVLHFLNLSTGKKYDKFEQSLETKIPREGPLVEREDLLEMLGKRLQARVSSSTVESTPAITMISGAQGMGKSRIVSELRHSMQLQEIPFLEIVCDWQVPVWPKIEKGLNIEDVVSGEMTEDWKIRVWVDAIIETAKHHPVCLLLDDYQKVDRTTKAVIASLQGKLMRLQREKQIPPIFILLATEESVEDALSLKRLSAAGILQYLNLVLGETDRNPALAKLLHQYCGGLPLLMVEGLRFLAPHLSKQEPLENLLPPPQIGLLYKEKIDALKADERDLLAILAFLFRPASEHELAKILQIKETELPLLANTCLKEELLNEMKLLETNESLYQVSSQALSLDIIRSIEPEKAEKLYGKIAQGLTEIGIVPKNEIAYFLAKSGDVDTAIQYYREASIQYKEHQQIGTASECLVKAINICQPHNKHWIPLLQDAAQLLILQGSLREAANYLGKISLRTWDIEELKGMLDFRMRNFPTSEEHYRNALELLPSDNLMQKIILKNSIGNLYLQLGRFEEASHIFEKSLEQQRTLPEEQQRRVTNNSLGLALVFKQDPEGAINFYKEEIARLKPDMVAEELSLASGIGFVLMHVSQYDEAIPYLTRAVDLSEKTGAMHSLFTSMGNLVSAYLKEAKYAETLPLLKKMSTYQERFGSDRDIAYNLLREGSIYLTLGMEEASHDCFQRGRKLAQDLNDLGLASWFLLMEGYRQKEFGDAKKAKKTFALADVEAHEHNDLALQAWSHYALADLAFDQEEIDECRSQIEAIGEPPADEEFRARMELIRAKIASVTTTEDLHLLFSHLETVCIERKLPELLWESYHAWARAELRRGNRAQAIFMLMKGIRVIENIADSLPEEYHDRYLKQNDRHKLFTDLKRLTQPERIKEKPSISEIHADETTIRGGEGTVADGVTPGKPQAEGTIADGPTVKEKAKAESTIAEGMAAKKPSAEGTIAESKKATGGAGLTVESADWPKSDEEDDTLDESGHTKS